MSTIYNYIGAWPAGASPTDQDVIDGTGATTHVTPVGESGIDLSQVVDGLAADTLYDIEWLAKDSADDSVRAPSVTFRTLLAALSWTLGPAAVRVKETSASAVFAFSEPQARACTVHAGVWTSASTPTEEQIIAGTGAIGGTHSTGDVNHASIAERASGDNLSTGSSYRWWLVVIDPDGVSNLVGSTDAFVAEAGGGTMAGSYYIHNMRRKYLAYR